MIKKGMSMLPKFSPLRALVTLGGWGGDVERDFQSFSSRSQYWLVLGASLFRVLVFLCSVMKLQGVFDMRAFIRELCIVLRNILPTLFLVVPGVFNEEGLFTYGKYAAFYRASWKSLVSLGLLSSLKAQPIVQAMKLHFLLEGIWYPLTEQVILMPWAIVLHFISVPIFAHTGSSQGTATDYMRSCTIQCLGICSRAWFEYAWRRSYYRRKLQEACHRRRSMEGFEVSFLTYSMTPSSIASTVPLELHQDANDARHDEAEEQMMRSCIHTDACFHGLEDAISYDESDEDDVSPSQPIEDVLTNIRALSSGYINKAQTRTTVQIYVPWAEPKDLKPAACGRIERMLQNEVQGACVVTNAVRKGSLIVTLEIVHTLDETAGQTMDDICSKISPSAWVECLDLAWPKDGEDVTVQVADSQVFTINWEDGSWRVIRKKLDSSPKTASQIISVSPQVCLLGSSYTSAFEAQVDLRLTATGPLESGKEESSASSSVLRARYLGSSLSVEFTDLNSEIDTMSDGEWSCKDSVKNLSPFGGENKSALQLRSVQACVRLLHDASENSTQQMCPGIMILEVWNDRMVVQSVPVLMLLESQQELLRELTEALQAAEPVPGSRDTKNMLEGVISKLGCWMHLMTKYKEHRKGESGGSDELIETRIKLLQKYLALEGSRLLELAVVRGMISMASFVVEELIGSGCAGWMGAALGINAGGYTLLHLAVLSGKSYMVKAAIQWGKQNGVPWKWNVRDVQNTTPLHLLACSGDMRLAQSVLQNFASARTAWERSTAGIGYSPETLAIKSGMKVKIPDRLDCPAPHGTPVLMHALDGSRTKPHNPCRLSRLSAASASFVHGLEALSRIQELPIPRHSDNKVSRLKWPPAIGLSQQATCMSAIDRAVADRFQQSQGSCTMILSRSLSQEVLSPSSLLNESSGEKGAYDARPKSDLVKGNMVPHCDGWSKTTKGSSTESKMGSDIKASISRFTRMMIPNRV